MYRNGRRVALLACYPLRDPAMPPQFISNHGMRMVEASLRAAGIDDLELKVWDIHHTDLDVIVSELLSFNPDVAGFSTYLWSFPFFSDVARELKQDDPARLIVFGGPSARPSMLGLEPHQKIRDWVDVLAINEGEQTFIDIVNLGTRTRKALMGLSGIAMYDGKRWIETPARPL
jgi:radical SAM superfamily enzyme YgiQ (UPF0313 family)